MLTTTDDDDDDDEAAAEPPLVRTNAWFGPGGTLSPLHYDRPHNLLFQVFGSKYIRLYAPDQTDNLYPHPPGHVHQISSQIIDPDVEVAKCKEEGEEEFPRLAEAPYVDFVLEAGECLYIPPKWWHFIESRETSFSVSFWWGE